MGAGNSRTKALHRLGQLARKGDLVGVQEALANGQPPDPDPKWYWGASPLYYAASGGHTEVVRALCKAGANVHWVPTDDPESGPRGDSCLMVAIAHGHEAAASVMLEHADVDHVAPDGMTELMRAGLLGQVRGAELLLERGATPGLRATGGRFKGKSAIAIAEAGKHLNKNRSTYLIGLRQTPQQAEFAAFLRENKRNKRYLDARSKRSGVEDGLGSVPMQISPHPIGSIAPDLVDPEPEPAAVVPLD